MPERNIFQPKQKRSQDTQQKLLDALHFCLLDKIFEHISIKELAHHAGVSVGTFYRRFKDKESLLPLLYQDFGNDLTLWVEQLEKRNYNSLQDALATTTHEALVFLIKKKSVFRTLHLNSRLHSELLGSDKVVDRKIIYQRLASILLRFESQITVADKEKAANLVVYMMITGLLDKVLYPDLTPAIACPHDANEFASELPSMLIAYLRS